MSESARWRGRRPASRKARPIGLPPLTHPPNLLLLPTQPVPARARCHFATVLPGLRWLSRGAFESGLFVSVLILWS